MSYGLQISASGVFGALYRQDVLANNLANMDTVGFKPEIATTIPRQAARDEDGLMSLPSNTMLERLGGGIMLHPNRLNMDQGGLRTTGRDLDVALQGEGFFAVKDTADPSADAVLLTRDGRLARNGKGQIVMATTGMPLLDAQNRPIEIAERGKVLIDGDGTVRQNGVAVGRLAVVDVPDRDALQRKGGSLFKPSPDQLKRKTAGAGQVNQGQVEESGVDEVKALMSVTSAARDVDANVALIQQHDRLLERAIQSLGRSA